MKKLSGNYHASNIYCKALTDFIRIDLRGGGPADQDIVCVFMRACVHVRTRVCLCMHVCVRECIPVCT